MNSGSLTKTSSGAHHLRAGRRRSSVRILSTANVGLKTTHLLTPYAKPYYNPRNKTMHPESKVFTRGQQGQMTEATGKHRGFTHTGDNAKHIQDNADVTGYSIYDGRKK